MRDAVVSRARSADIVIIAAAVADYTPAGGAEPLKVGKLLQGSAMSLTLERTADILAELGAMRSEGRMPLLVGFAAETGDAVPAAQRKLTAKNVDLIVANDVTAPGAGFEVDTNVVALVSPDGVERLPMMAKTDVASAILDRVERTLPAVGAAAPVV